MKLAASILSVALAAAATTFAPAADARMTLGNYELLSDRWGMNSWIWVIRHSCGPACSQYYPPNPDGVLGVTAIPRPYFSAPFEAEAFPADGRYTLTVDVPDGVQCPGYGLPSHDVYSWDEATLAGTVESSFDAGCFGAPAGTKTYTFALKKY